MRAGDHDIEAGWTLFHTCNYRCDYCFFPPALLGSKRPELAANADWQRAFDATGLVWLINLTGGEPSLHPAFADLCRRLTARHWLSVNSNLVPRAWQTFADTVDPARVRMVHAAFHPLERQARDGDGRLQPRPRQRLRHLRGRHAGEQCPATPTVRATWTSTS